jgi:hypothetical protein
MREKHPLLWPLIWAAVGAVVAIAIFATVTALTGAEGQQNDEVLDAQARSQPAK